MARTEPGLTDAQWAALEPLLPPRRPATGHPNNDHRQVVEAMMWLARTGAPGGTCRPSTAPGRRWPAASTAGEQGIFQRLLAEVHRRVDACGELDWLVHYVDGSVVRAHQHAAGARHNPLARTGKGDRPPAR
jgi:transposase